MTNKSTSGALRQFNQDGFLGPVSLLTRRECRSLMSYLDSGTRPTPAEWPKGAAVTDWLLYRLAANPRLLELVKLLLGEEVILWGCSIVRRRPQEVHPWHVDIETSASDGRSVSVWIGLENTKRNGALELIAGSHTVGKVVQQIQSERGHRRGEATTEAVLGWARERNGAAVLARPQLEDGDALLFDGRLWHGSRNVRRSGTRTALLLQFASADTPISMHDETALEWPFPPTSKPPVIVLHGGVTDENCNWLVRPPMPSRAKGRPMLSTCVIPLDLPLEEQPGGGWKPYQLFGGGTPVLDHMNCHASVLSAGHCPHLPHAHNEEELLIVLDGEAELLIADGPFVDGARVERVGPGAFAYYPAFQHHTIRNPGPGPVTYLMFKWHIDGAQAPPEQIGANLFHCPDERSTAIDGWMTERIMEGATRWLGQLHCHISDLAPGAGYEPHVDAYDVAILMLSGCIETLGQQVLPHGVIYYAAGERHGIRNIGDKPARYLVFEFHPCAIDVGQRLKRRFTLAAKQVLKRAALELGLDLGKLRVRLNSRI